MQGVGNVVVDTNISVLCQTRITLGQAIVELQTQRGGGRLKAIETPNTNFFEMVVEYLRVEAGRDHELSLGHEYDTPAIIVLRRRLGPLRIIASNLKKIEMHT